MMEFSEYIQKFFDDETTDRSSLQLGPNFDPGEYGEHNDRPYPLLKESASSYGN